MTADPSVDLVDETGTVPPVGLHVLPLTLVDVFAAHRLEGNLLAVLHDVDGLSTASMNTIARRLRLSETSFLQRPSVPGADYRHRIFTADGEIPFAGHPSLGAAAAVAHRASRSRATYLQQTDAGLQPVTVDLDRAGSGMASMRQNEAVFGPPLEVGSLPAALGSAEAAFHPRLPVQLVSTGLPTLIVPLKDSEALRAIEIRWPLLNELMSTLGPIPSNCYVVAEVGAGRWRARCFAADLPGGEDPATGSAAGALGAYLDHHLGVRRTVIEQGGEIGMPSEIHVDAADGVVVSGQVHIVGTGQLTVP